MFEKIMRFFFPFTYIRRDLNKYERKMKTYYKQQIGDIFAGKFDPDKYPAPPKAPTL